MLFKQVAVATPVTVVNQPVKTGWVDGELYLEIHPSLAQADEIETTGKFTPEPIADLDRIVFEAAGPLTERIDWPAVDRIASARTGVPAPVFRRDADPADARRP
jgi:L,D-transpeptidase ErfK/SrfK